MRRRQERATGVLKTHYVAMNSLKSLLEQDYEIHTSGLEIRGKSFTITTQLKEQVRAKLNFFSIFFKSLYKFCISYPHS